MVAEYRVSWTNAEGGTGVSVFHFLGATEGAESQSIATAVRNQMLQIRTQVPSTTTFQCDNEVLVLNTVTGVLENAFPVDGDAAFSGTGPAAHAAGVGAVITWETGQFVAGHRLRGRTFIVPISGSLFDAQGTLVDTAIDQIETPAQTLITLVPIGVWSRTHGVFHLATDARVNDKVATLRSRRT